MSSKSTKITNMAKDKAIKREAEVIAIIEQMVKNGEKITFYSVQKASNASKSYLYGNEKIKITIEKYRNDNEGNGRKEESKDAIIKAQRLQIKRLESEIQILKDMNSDSYKTKYEKLQLENKELKKQLQTACKY